MLTQKRLKEVLHYDPETGLFRRALKTSNRVKVGEIAGTENAYGYLVICVEGKLHQAQRLAWLYMTGEWPEFIDHKNGHRADNRWSNLRDCTRLQNQANMKKPSHNTSGLKGVSLHSEAQKWRAKIQVNKKTIHLGLFATKRQAHDAYCEAARRYHGEFARFS